MARFHNSKRKRSAADARAQVTQLSQRIEAKLATNPARMVRRALEGASAKPCMAACAPQDSEVKALVASVFGSPAALGAAVEAQADEAQVLDSFRSVASALNAWRNKCVAGWWCGQPPCGGVHGRLDTGKGWDWTSQCAPACSIWQPRSVSCVPRCGWCVQVSGLTRTIDATTTARLNSCRRTTCC